MSEQRKQSSVWEVVLGLSGAAVFWGSIAYFGSQYQERQEKEHPKTCRTETIEEIVSSHYRDITVRTVEGTVMDLNQSSVSRGSKLYICRRNNTGPMLEWAPK